MKQVLLLITLTFIPFFANAEMTHSDIFKMINERLKYMEDVALYKAHNQLAIEDLAREKIVINRAKAVAKKEGLSPEHIEGFFKMQIIVAKAIQFRYRADLLFQPSSIKPKQLNQHIRPQLIKLGNKIIQQIAVYIKAHQSFNKTQFHEFSQAISVNYATESDKQLLFNTLLKIKQLPTH
ncbi:gamma subclass chorismate mutase AroQ [Aliikangiella sp. IMCC44359]|uniref:gamma subclass chorismate mutase AroQ n=1 Tax=Aliikangiella sp. IMCC44359 TaxID=3459125 RepID=UPI00403AE94C